MTDVSLSPNPFDPKCGRYARDIPDYDSFIFEGEPVTPQDRINYVVNEEGTYNPLTDHFLCDQCYIDAGCPASPSGWKCP